LTEGGGAVTLSDEKYKNHYMKNIKLKRILHANFVKNTVNFTVGTNHLITPTDGV
jgi:hypothetical protein